MTSSVPSPGCRTRTDCSIRISQGKRGQPSSSKVAVFTRASGRAISEMALASSYGPMALSTLASGLTTRPTEKEDSSTRMATFMREIGRMTRLMGMASTSIQMEICTEATGKMISRMASDLSHGQIPPATEGSTAKEESTGSELISGTMDPRLWACGK